MSSNVQPRAALGWLCTTASLADLALPKQPVQGRQQPETESSCVRKVPMLTADSRAVGYVGAPFVTAEVQPCPLLAARSLSMKK